MNYQAEAEQLAERLFRADPQMLDQLVNADETEIQKFANRICEANPELLDLMGKGILESLLYEGMLEGKFKPTVVLQPDGTYETHWNSAATG